MLMHVAFEGATMSQACVLNGFTILRRSEFPPEGPSIMDAFQLVETMIQNLKA
jgi:hypothetical protein